MLVLKGGKGCGNGLYCDRGSSYLLPGPVSAQSHE